MCSKQLTICLVCNGSQFLRNRTLDSLQAQTMKSFEYRILTDSTFWSSDRNQLVPEEGYVLFLYSGSILEETAVEKILQVADSRAPEWMYFDEQNYEAVICNENEGIFEKPDFDLLSFVEKPWTGEGLVFSCAWLRSISLQYEGKNFGAAIQEIAIAAASHCEGFHIRANLLTRHNRKPLFPDERELLNRGLKESLRFRFPQLLALEKADSPGLVLLPKVAPPKHCSIILLAETEEEVPLLSYGDLPEIIPICVNGSYYEALIRGARAASFPLLCFVQASCSLFCKEDLLKLLNLLSMEGIASVSPMVEDTSGIAYCGICSYAGGPVRIPGAPPDTLIGDLRALREVSTPARQLWVTHRQLLLDLPDFPEMHTMSPNLVLAEIAARFRDQGLKNLYAGSIQVMSNQENEEPPKGFCSHLFRRQGAFFPDPLCPTDARAWLRRDVLKSIRAYFPEQSGDFRPDRKRILVLTHELSLTGAPIVLTHAVRILKEEGYQILVGSPEDGVLKQDFLRDGIPVTVLGDMEKNLMWMEFARDFDLILVNTVVLFRQIEQLRQFPVPVLWWLHDAKSGYEDYLCHVLPDTLGSNIHTFSVSQYADDVVRSYRPKYRTDLLLYGLKDEALRMDEVDIPSVATEGRKVFISVGTIIRRKGQDILAHAIRLLPEEVRTQCLFLFIGKPIDSDIYAAVTELQADYPDDVRLITSVPHDEVFALYHHATAVICSSRDDPLPTFMAETMMVSGVCICSENTGTAAVIENGRNGYVYSNDDPEDLARCIQMVVDCKDFQTIKRESRKTFEEVFSMDIFRKNLLNCVNQCITPPEGELEHE